MGQFFFIFLIVILSFTHMFYIYGKNENVDSDGKLVVDDKGEPV